MKKKGTADRAVTTAAAAAALIGAPVAGGMFQVFWAGLRQVQEWRVQRWWSIIIEGDADPEALTDRINRALLDANDAMGPALIAGARAAAEAFDPVVLPSIALLSRKFFRTGTPTRRVYKDMLGILMTLDPQEFGDLRTAVHKLQAIPGTKEEIHTNLIYDQGHSSWNWYSTVSARQWPSRRDGARRVLWRA